MFSIIPPSQFKTVPWKNGKGETIELAINEGGTLDKFDWRVSIASVVEDGVFSDFSGYHRNLVLISGNGICLSHINSSNEKLPDNKLDSLLKVASFDGGNQTTGQLSDGSITDFNIITNNKKYQAKVKTFTSNSKVQFNNAHLTFCYSLSDNLKLKTADTESTLPQGHLLRISKASSQITETACIIDGCDFILIELIGICSTLNQLFEKKD